MKTNKFISFLLISFLIIITSQSSIAQIDTTKTDDNMGFITIDSTNTFVPVEDVVIETEIDTTLKKSPRKAALMSAVFPGLGQIYNGKYWKVPIVWGLVGGSFYFTKTMMDTYNMYLNDYVAILQNTDAKTVSGTTDLTKLLDNKERFKKFRNYSVIACVLLYTFNIIDANVDAHFANFDVSEDLTMNFSPTIFNLNNNNYSFGINLALSF